MNEYLIRIFVNKKLPKTTKLGKIISVKPTQEFFAALRQKIDNLKAYLKEQSQKQVQLFQNTTYPLTFKPYYAIQGAAVFAVLMIFFFIATTVFFPQPAINPTQFIKSAQTKQLTPVVAEGAPIKWTTLIKKSDITAQQNKVALPKNAHKIKVSTITTQQALAIATIQIQDPTLNLTTHTRKQLAGRFDVDLAGISLRSTSTAGLAEVGQIILRFFQSLNTYLFADLEQAVSNVADSIVQQNTDTITETQTATVVDLSSEVPTEPTGSSDIVETQETQTQTEYVAVTYETDAPTITEQETETGKLITVSNPDETTASTGSNDLLPPSGSSDTFSGATSDVTTTLTNVLAFTNIPEIYKVGQEDKIKLKWKNNGDQPMEFHAYDLNNNGKLDYVEWTVPHLSDQVFEIIFISKAWLLDSSKEIQEDIYDQVATQDGTYATVPTNNYVRVTFQATLTNNNDITVYAKPASPVGESRQAPTIAVYATDTNQLVATFDPITEEGTYKVLLTTLQTPTDKFDLRITGGSLDIDYIVDPVGWLTGWAHRKKITIDNANVDADLTNFPTLVKLTSDSQVGASSLSTGYDVRFTDAGGTTLLKYERESWSGGAGAAATANFWVKVPTVATAADTDIYMYYGKSDATDGADAANVWDSGFAGVWHLNDPTNPIDSTSNNNDGTNYGSTATTGKIGGAGSFDGTNDYISAGDINAIDGASALTFSVWINPNAWDSSDFVMEKGNVMAIGKHTGIGLAGFGIQNASEVWKKSNFTPSLGAWQYIVGVYNGSNVISYIDNVSNTGDSCTSVNSTAYSFNIGGRDTSFPFNGLIDEVRVSSTARSAQWIKFEYHNQSDSGNNLTFSTQENNLTWLAGWSYRKKITIDHTKVGATTEDQTNFPVLVSLTGLSNINTNGTDIRFTTQDGGTYLAREIESYSSGTLLAWVKIPVLSHDYDTSIYMYYGNSSATEPAANSTYGSQNVWDSNFKAVYHLKEATNATVNDSTSNANNSTSQTWTQAAGKVDGGASVNNNSITTPITTAFTDFTACAWFNSASVIGYDRVIDKSFSDGFWIGRYSSTSNSWGGGIKQGSDPFGIYVTLTDGQWNYICSVRSGTTHTISGNGGAVSQSETVTGDALDTTALTIAMRAGTAQYLNGSLDEVRVSSAARSAGWISTEYANQNSPSTFYTVATTESNASDWLSGWSNRKKITIKKTQVDADLTNFPLLVKLTSNADLATALSTGYDVRFTSSDGTTILPYERESWTGGAGTAVTANLWVKVPTITTAADTDLWLYYGKSDATDGADPTNVWDSNYKGVWHLGETTGQHQDSTSNNKDSTTVSVATQGSATGKVGGADDFNGSTSYVEVSPFAFIAPPFTISAWVKDDAAAGGNDYKGIVSRGNFSENNTNFDFGIRTYSANNFRLFMLWKDASTLYGTETISAVLDDGALTYVTGVVDSSYNLNLLVNGASIGTDGSNSAPTDGSQSLKFGSGLAKFDGQIDEVRISSVARSASWIKFEYHNMNSADNELVIESSSTTNGITWTNGSGDNKWSTAANWQGGVAPTASDTAVFTSSATDNCTIDTNVSVAQINMSSGYTGTITQSSSYTVAVSDDMTVAGGTFATGAGGVTVAGNLTVNGTLSGSTAVTLSGSSKIIYGSGTISAPVTISANHTIDSTANITISGVPTLSAGVVLTNNGILTLSSNSNYTISNVIAGSGTLIKSGTGTLTLSGNNTFSGGVTIKAGTVYGSSGSNANVFGTGTITLGDTSGSANATLQGAGFTYANPITVASGSSSNTLTVSGAYSTFSGLVTLNNNLTVSTWSTTNPLTFTGGVTGTGNIIINSATGIGGVISFTTTSVDNTGTITNSGGGSGTTAISTTIGSHVIGVIQNSATSQLTLSGNNSSFAGGVTIKAGTVLLQTSANAAGTGTITIGDSSGSASATLYLNAASNYANLIEVAAGSSGTLSISSSNVAYTLSNTINLNNNLTINGNNVGSTTTVSGSITGTGNLTINHAAAGGFTFSGTSINNAGTITHSGVGAGTTIISGVIGSAVTGVVQNSATSALTLSGNNSSFAGGVTIKAGILALWTSTNAAGSGTITIGNTSGSADVTLKAVDITISNAITVASGNTGALSIQAYGVGTYSGAITLYNNLLLYNPTIYLLTISGAISGTGNITINNASSGGTTLSNASPGIDFIGTITNSGTGAGTTTISGVIGSAVTGVIQNSATSLLTLSGDNSSFAGGVTIKAGILRVGLNSDGSGNAGTGTITIGDTTGSEDATLQTIMAGTFVNNIVVASGNTGTALIYRSGYVPNFTGSITLPTSPASHDLSIRGGPTISGGITGTGNITFINGSSNTTVVQTVSINNTGTITNTDISGGTSGTTISAVIGANVTGVVQNSATSQLTLSGNNSSFAGGG